MIFNYKTEVENILTKIYEHEMYNIAIKKNLTSITSDNLEDTIKLFKETNVYIGSDLDDFIINCIPDGADGYHFRSAIAKYKNYSYPKLYDYKGNLIENPSHNKVAFRLWESYMDKMLIEDIQRGFNKTDFHNFIEKNLKNMSNDIVTHVKEYNKNKKILIPLNNKDDLLDVIKSMILNGKLDSQWIDLLVDIEKIRDYMLKLSVTFSVYNEFDKLEDDLEYCLDNFCKYNSSQLFDLLVNEKGFKFEKGVGLIKN